MIRFLPLILLAACVETAPSGLDTVETRPVQRSDGLAARAAERASEAEKPICIGVDVDGEEIEIPCPLRDGDPAFIAQVQRALAARGLYGGADDGTYGAGTRRAVAAYQDGRKGPKGGTLSLEAAKSLGLVALGRDEA